MSTAPTAFISHATEDKQRFVNEFAKQLRGKGVDAWFDAWEIKAGDSLVEKIFEEGIKKTSAFIVIISATSITKPWVREELDSGMVGRIAKSCRLIPVIIDDCDVPHTIKHLKWVKIRDLNNYENELAEITNAIFGANEKPSLGPAPAHFATRGNEILPNLTKADNLIFAVLCRHFLKTGEAFFQTAEIFNDLMALGLSESEVDDSLRILAGRNYIQIKTIQGVTIWGIELSSTSLEAFMQIEVAGYNEMFFNIVTGIVNKELKTNTLLHEQTSVPMPIVMHILNILTGRGLLRTTGPAGFQFLQIMSVSPELKRILH